MPHDLRRATHPDLTGAEFIFQSRIHALAHRLWLNRSQSTPLSRVAGLATLR